MDLATLKIVLSRKRDKIINIVRDKKYIKFRIFIFEE